jgi:hypothetical protein
MPGTSPGIGVVWRCLEDGLLLPNKGEIATLRTVLVLHLYHLQQLAAGVAGSISDIRRHCAHDEIAHSCRHQFGKSGPGLYISGGDDSDCARRRSRRYLFTFRNCAWFFLSHCSSPLGFVGPLRCIFRLFAFHFS